MFNHIHQFITTHKINLFVPWAVLTVFILADLAKTWHFQGFSQPLAREMIFIFLAYYSWMLIAVWIGFQQHSKSHKNRQWLYQIVQAFLLGIFHILLVCALLWLITPGKVSKAAFHLVFFEFFYRWIVVELVLYGACFAFWQWVLRNNADKDTIVLKTTDGHLNCEPNLIKWAQTDGNYINFKYKNEHHKIRITLKTLTNLLTPHLFQIHRSSAINLTFIEQISDQRVIMQDGTRLPISNNNKKTLLAAIEKTSAS